MKACAIAIGIAVFGNGVCACGGEPIADSDEPETGTKTTQGSCISAECASKVGGPSQAPGNLCGSEPNGAPGYVIWYGEIPFADSGTPSRENCVCQKSDAGLFTRCDVVPAAHCAAQTDCAACNATPACAWCNGSTSTPPSYCAFRPAFDCTRASGQLAKPDCSP